MLIGKGAQLRQWSYVLGASVAAMAAASANPAAAQCTPDPTIRNGLSDCTGTDNNGLVVSTNGTRVAVATDAIVRSGTAAGAITFTEANGSLTVNGLIDGGNKAGIAVVAGPTSIVPCDPYAGASVGYCPPGSVETNYPWATANVVVAEGATVTGAQAVLMDRVAGNTRGYVSVSLDNAGTMFGTAGPALVNAANGNSMLSVTNRATGRIDGISGATYVTNAGMIDGRSGSAITIASSTNYASIGNTGSILSSGTAATVSTADAVSITNSKGAVLGGGTTAISSGGALTLTNEGTINGSVISTAPAGQNSVIDTRNGIINGDLILGAGNDTLRAQFDAASGRISSITGTIDGGAGSDTIMIGIDSDAQIGGVVLPTNFEVLGLDLSKNATATLTSSFSTGTGIALSGYGKVISQANISTTGAAITAAYSGYSLSFTNEGNITATLSNVTEAAVGGSFNLINSGAITANGGAGARADSKLDNSGVIIASGTAAAVNYGTFTNNGSIRSTQGVGASISGSSYSSTGGSSNEGTITGATIGVNLLSGTLTNSGTITGGVTGVGMGSGAKLINAASGIISGGIAGSSNLYNGNATVANAGTINGSVDFTGLSTYGSNDLFLDEGGTVNGAILLGNGDDLLVTNLVNAADRPFAGATGGVNAGDGYDTLRYIVNADASTNATLPTGFEALAYELDNGSSLTVNAGQGVVSTIGLTGNGTVTLEGTISGSNRAVIDTTISTTGQLFYGVAGVSRDLTVINNGQLSLTKTDPYSYSSLGAIYAGQATVVNNGSIAVTTPAGSYYAASGIQGGKAVTNAGTITVIGGGIGISGGTTVVNTGVITDTDDKRAQGIANFGSLNNSGTISVDGAAVSAGYSYSGTGNIVNSGTIESRSGSAVIFGSYSYGAALTNEATGIIRGVTAVDISAGGSIINRGMIVGDVASPTGFGYSSTYYLADGGTVTGNVAFGSGYDAFIMAGTESGVSGTIDGGDGIDTLGYTLSASADLSLDRPAQFINFEHTLVQALGSDTTITVSATDPFIGNLLVGGDGKVVNAAAITGGVSAGPSYIGGLPRPEGVVNSVTFENQGSISNGVSGTVSSFVNNGSIAKEQPDYANSSGVQLYNDTRLTFANSGKIETGTSLNSNTLDVSNSGYISLSEEDDNAALAMALSQTVDSSENIKATLVNSGEISGYYTAIFGSTSPSYNDGYFLGYPSNAEFSVTNTQNGIIRGRGIALSIREGALTLNNAGLISGLPLDSVSDETAGYAVATSGDFADTIDNSGILEGGLWLDDGNDRVENRGNITGSVLLGRGDDLFIQHASGTLSGLIDGGEGADSFVLDTTGGAISLSAAQLVSFEQVTQTGTGIGIYSGAFETDTIALQGGTLVVAAGQSLATTGSVTVTGGNSGVQVVNEGTITGAVVLGAGNDSYIEGTGSLASGGVDGGPGIDLYRVVLAGDRTGIGARTGFEQLLVEGSGTLALRLDQSFDAVALSGTSLTAALGGFSIGRIDGSAAAEQVRLDGDIGIASLGAGNDSLELAATTLAGRYDGGEGIDALHLAADGPVTLTGIATGFETLSLTSNILTIAGTLGSSDSALAFGDGNLSLTVASGGVLAGAIDLGAGNDTFRLKAGGALIGTVSGGAGTDTATLEIANAFTLESNRLTDFERLQAEGTGALTLAGGNFGFDAVNSATDLIVASGASLSAGLVGFHEGNNRLVIAGTFAGSVAGGAGADTIEVAGNAAFGTVSDIEALRMSAGLATISGNAALGNVSLTGGRLVGLAGSIIDASAIQVAQGATFGSAGIINGNVTVAGILSPGASPGTMTVNGNVALTGTSISVFEVTPTVSDKLVINGDLSIAQGATLQIVADTVVTPGKSLDIIAASGSITGSFTNIIKPAYLFGFLVQDGDSITLMGQFLDDTAYTGQVRGAIDYVNSVLVNGQASSVLLAAVPGLVTATGASNQTAFMQLTPEAYASASQIAVEQGLELAATGRSDAFATRREKPGGFTFASALGNTRTLESGANGTARTRTNGYGFLGGLGFGSAEWSVGGFVGYLDSHQTLLERGARTNLDGIAAGLHGRWTGERLGIKATLAYSGGKASTHRALPGGSGGAGSASSEYDLTGWTADASVDYTVPLDSNWTVRPSLGITAIRVTRDGAIEKGSNPFALAVARERSDAVFVDSALTFKGGVRDDAKFRPYLSVGVRYQIDGRTPFARAAIGSGGYGLQAAGVSRAPVLATGTLGADLALSSRLSLFVALSGEAGNADNRASARTGVRLAF